MTGTASGSLGATATGPGIMIDSLSAPRSRHVRLGLRVPNSENPTIHHDVPVPRGYPKDQTWHKILVWPSSKPAQGAAHDKLGVTCVQLLQGPGGTRAVVHGMKVTGCNLPHDVDRHGCVGEAMGCLKVLQAGYTRLLLGGGEWFKLKGCGAGCGGATQVQW